MGQEYSKGENEMKIKLKRNISTGLAVRTTLKAGFDDPKNPCQAKCFEENKYRMKVLGWRDTASFDERDKCLLTCPTA